jgi:hypothetical protein
MHGATVKKNGSLCFLAPYFQLFQCHLHAPCRIAPWEAAQMAHPLIWPSQVGGGGKNHHTNFLKGNDPKFKVT